MITITAITTTTIAGTTSSTTTTTSTIVAAGSSTAYSLILKLMLRDGTQIRCVLSKTLACVPEQDT